MKFGINASPFLWWTVEQFENWILKVEELGFDSILIPDHYDLPVPPFPSNELVDAWTTLAYIAAKTFKLKLGSLVSPLPRWVPSQLAKVITTVDVLSNGRVVVGLGVGYNQSEFVNYAPNGLLDEPRIRFEKFIEGLKIMIKLWTEDKVTFNGKYYKLENAILKPKPVQKPYPPLWSGGMGPKMIKATAKYFNGWMPPGFAFEAGARCWTPEEYLAYAEKIKGYLKEFGKDECAFTFGILHGINSDAKLVEKYRDAGCQYFIVDVCVPRLPKDPAEGMEWTKKFAAEVISSF